MGKRPMCWLCLLLMAGIWLGDLTGVIPIKSISSSQPAQQASVYGQIYQYYYSENSVGICLKNVYLESQTNLYSHQTEKKTKPWGQTMVYMQEESDTSLPLGTWIRVKGKLQAIEGPRNPGEFDGRLYYQTRKIDYRMSGQELTVCKRQTWYLRESLRQIREALVHSLKRAAPKQAGMFCAMITGEKSLLKQEEKNLLAVGSLSHIISISGMHLSLLGMLCFHLLQRLRMGILSASVCSAMSQGYIGYDLQNGIRSELLRRGIYKPVSTILTQMMVNPYDDSFYHPIKKIGRYMTRPEADAEEAKGNYVTEVPGHGWQRIISAPKPVSIVEIDAIRALFF